MSVAGRLGLGWLGDRLDMRRVTDIGFLMICIGMLLFAIMTKTFVWLVVPFAVLYGIGCGSINTVSATLQ